jgi:hypothetical protein
MVLLFLTLNAMDRPLLSRPKLWLVLAGSLVAWVPPLIWNWRHGWLTYRHTLHHFDAGSTAFVERLVRLVEFLGFQGGLVTPLVFICLIAALALALRRWRTIGPRERLLVFFSAPGLLAMMLLTWRQRVNPNWPAVFYPAATVLLVAWAAGVWGTGTGLERLRRWFAPALKLGLILAILTYVAVLGLSTGWLRLPTLDPSARLRGWSELARDVGDELARTPRPKETLVITQSHRFATSELAFYVPGHPKVFRFNSKPDVIESQYDLWYPRADGTVDALVIVQGTASALDPRLHARFSTIRFLKELRYPRQAGGRKIYSLFIGERLQHWPRPLPPG